MSVLHKMDNEEKENVHFATLALILSCPHNTIRRYGNTGGSSDTISRGKAPTLNQLGSKNWKMTQNPKGKTALSEPRGGEGMFLPPMHTPGFCQADCHDDFLLAQQRAMLVKTRSKRKSRASALKPPIQNCYLSSLKILKLFLFWGKKIILCVNVSMVRTSYE
ncbi:hypothetical protein CRENBAI_011897 [Crenichthys baileyi]|uniref:Uncharacterized protein n=1 Tax=Crenichthys baileyi TaxID=28760 RepID=A0AAV9SDL4_9TELE